MATSSMMQLASFGDFESIVFELSSQPKKSFPTNGPPPFEWMAPCHVELQPSTRTQEQLYQLDRVMDYVTRIWLQIDPLDLIKVELLLHTVILQTVTPESLAIARIRSNEPQTSNIVSIPLFFTPSQPLPLAATPFSALYVRVTARGPFTVHQDGFLVNGDLRHRMVVARNDQSERRPVSHNYLSEQSETSILPYASDVLLPLRGSVKAFFFMVRVHQKIVPITKPISLHCNHHTLLKDVSPDYFSVIQPHTQGMSPLESGYYMYSFAQDHRSLAHTGAPNCEHLNFSLSFGDELDDSAELVVVCVVHMLIHINHGSLMKRQNKKNVDEIN
jgi:hypothetical protein